MSKARKKKDGEDQGKRRRRMRESVAARQAAEGPRRPARDEVDKIRYKQGSAGDRTRSGAP